MDEAGTASIFEAVVASHKGILYKVAHAYCKDVEDRKDLVQEMLVQLWRSFHRYDHRHQYSTWIYRIALNVAISFYRKEHRRREIAHPMTEGLLNLAADPSFEPDPNLVVLQQFIMDLGELDKAILLLYLEEKSYKEIAYIMGIKETNVATKIARIKAALKTRFENIKK
jgi:RNA polymerase sigma factor (sigma-70 family)